MAHIPLPAGRSRPPPCPTESGFGWILGSLSRRLDRYSLLLMLLLLLPRMLVALPGQWSLFLCNCWRAGADGGGGYSTLLRQQYSAPHQLQSPQQVLLLVLRSHHHQPDYGARVTGYRCAGSPNKHTPLNLFAIRDRISACNRHDGRSMPAAAVRGVLYDKMLMQSTYDISDRNTTCTFTHVQVLFRAAFVDCTPTCVVVTESDVRSICTVKLSRSSVVHLLSSNTIQHKTTSR